MMKRKSEIAVPKIVNISTDEAREPCVDSHTCVEPGGHQVWIRRPGVIFEIIGCHGNHAHVFVYISGQGQNHNKGHRGQGQGQDHI